jgi:HEAT repeat protein
VVVRRKAAQQLSDLPQGAAKQLILRAMDDPDQGVRVAASHAAREFRLTEAAERAVSWLSDPERDVRVAAAELLYEAPLARAVLPLGRLLADPDATVRGAAAAALGVSRSPDAALPLLGHLDDLAPPVRQAVVSALAELGDRRAVVPLIGKVQDPRPDVRQRVARALGGFGDTRATSALVLSLRDEDEAVRIAAVEALGQLRDATATLPVVTLMRDDHRQTVQSAALAALGRIGTDEALAAIVEQLGRDPVQVANARAALVRAGPQAVAALVACLEGQPDAARANACATTLGDLGDRRGTRSLISAVERGVAAPSAALGALARIGDPEALSIALEHLNHRQYEVRVAAIAAASVLLDEGRADGRAVEPIARALAAPKLTKEERIGLVQLLGKTRSSRAAQQLVALATDADDVALRVAAIDALGNVRAEAHEVVLLEALQDEEATVRLAAALALRRTASPRSARALLDALSRRAEQDREALVLALAGSLSRTADRGIVERVARVTAASRFGERDALIEALGHAPGELGSAPLVRLGERSSAWSDRAKVAEALASHAEAAPAVRRLVRDHDARVRAAATWSLGDVGTADDLRLLGELQRDADVTVAANAAGAVARVATRVRSARAGALLCSALADKRSFVRASALRGLRLLSARCASGVELKLLHDDSELVRASAATLLRAAPARHADQLQVEANALERCATQDLSGRVAAACGEPAPRLPRTVAPVLVFVVPSGESEPVPNAPFTLLRADGLLRFGTTDRRGAAFEHAAPRGFVSLEVAAPLAR